MKSTTSVARRFDAIALSLRSGKPIGMSRGRNSRQRAGLSVLAIIVLVAVCLALGFAVGYWSKNL